MSCNDSVFKIMYSIFIFVGNLRLGEAGNRTILQAQNMKQQWNGMHLFNEGLKN